MFKRAKPTTSTTIPSPATLISPPVAPTASVEEDTMSTSCATQGGSETHTLKESASLDAPKHQVVVDHPGTGRVVHRPDGTIVWEALPERREGDRNVKQRAQQVALEFATGVAVCSVAIGGMAGMTTTMAHIFEAFDGNKRQLTSRQLTHDVAVTVAGSIAGMLTGMALGPLHVAHALAVHLVRPAMFGLVVHRGVAWLRRHRAGVAKLINKLQSGVYSHQVEALRAIIMRAAQSSAFCREFHKFAGVEVLVKQLRDVLAAAEATGSIAPVLHLLAEALAQLVGQDTNCKEALVVSDGVPMLIQLLGPPASRTGGGAAAGALRQSNGSSLALVHSAVAGLSAVAEHPLAQDALRDVDAVARLLELATSPPRGLNSHVRIQALCLLTEAALDPAGKAAVGQAGGVPALLRLVKTSTPRSAVQAQAVMALHAAVRGDPNNQAELYEQGGADKGGEMATTVLRAALVAAGPHWCAHKADLHALLNVVARRKAAVETGASARRSAALPSPPIVSPAASPATSPSLSPAGSPASPRNDGGWVDDFEQGCDM